MMTLASVIVAGNEQVAPYFDELMPKLLSYAEAEDEFLQAKTIIAIGRLAHAVGKEKYQPYLEPISQKVMAIFKEHKAMELSEAGLNYFSDIAQILKEDFAPLLPTLIPIVNKACVTDDGLKIDYKEEDANFIDLGDDEPEMKNLFVSSSSINERSSALYAMGMFALSCPKGFLPYVKTCLDTLEVIRDFVNESIRAQAIQTYQEFVEALNLAHYGSGEQPKPVLGLPAKVKLGPDAHKLHYEIVLPLFIERIQNDGHREVVCQILTSLFDMCERIGPAVVEESLPGLLEAILLILKGKAPCQLENSDEDEDESEQDEDANSDESLIESAMNLVENIARVCGEVIVPHMKPVLKALSKYLQPNQTEGDWEIAMGCFAQLFHHLPCIIPEYGPALLSLCSKFSSLDSDPLIWNSMYCIGMIAKGSRATAEANMNEMLMALKTGYESAKTQEPKDNAVSSILRLLVIFPDKLPLEIILPAVFGNIPLSGDVRENVNVAKSLMELELGVYKGTEKYLENALMTCVKCIVDVECSVVDEDKALIGGYLVKISSVPEVESTLKGMIGRMSADEVSQLQSYLK
eukprot:TRINITY_DN1883_c0_g1_i18.p1 TRINITY_DN1883_c0_g1~~TRINITY_DN1883_c0_g1_i18.p1  ORF type:complete len:577 (+),score=148.63 TRINITY_DN1883_c0_g1_i18:1647-3377(+)